MKLLLDTHAALWWWENSSALGKKARKAMINPEHEIYFSAASAYEIHQKVRLKKLTVPDDLLGEGLELVVHKEGWRLLPIKVSDASLAASLDHPHRDPFDRILAAQSMNGSFTLASRDPFFNSLQIDRLWS